MINPLRIKRCNHLKALALAETNKNKKISASVTAGEVTAGPLLRASLWGNLISAFALLLTPATPAPTGCR